MSRDGEFITDDGVTVTWNERASAFGDLGKDIMGHITVDWEDENGLSGACTPSVDADDSDIEDIIREHRQRQVDAQEDDDDDDDEEESDDEDD
jgi:hypothetical protein